MSDKFNSPPGGQRIKGVHRGDIYWVRFSQDSVGSEQSGMRPAVVIQNDIGNLHSPTVIVAPLTSRKNKPPLPTHVHIDFTTPANAGQPGKSESIVLLEQIIVIDKRRICGKKLKEVSEKEMQYIDEAINTSLGLSKKYKRGE